LDEIAGFSNTRLSNNVDFRPEADVYIEVDLYFCLMIQQLLIALLFAAALFYLGRMGWRAWRAKNACSNGVLKTHAVRVVANVVLPIWVRWRRISKRPASHPKSQTCYSLRFYAFCVTHFA